MHGQTIGKRAFSGRELPSSLRTFLLPNDESDPQHLQDDNLVPVGLLEVNGVGNGRIDFEVPDIDPGGYVVIVSCPSCAPYSAGRELLPAGEFRVLGNSEIDASQPSLIVAIGLLGVLAILGFLAHIWRRRSSTTHEPPAVS